MSVTSHIFAIISALLILIVALEYLRRRLLRERHAVWWVLAGLLALIAGLFPDIIGLAANALGIEIPINLVFFVSVAILFLVCLQSSSELTTLENKARTLAETVTLQELRLRALESSVRAEKDLEL
jgi:hypothetical protein